VFVHDLALHPHYPKFVKDILEFRPQTEEGSSGMPGNYYQTAAVGLQNTGRHMVRSGVWALKLFSGIFVTKT
jgi:hypothetical protein